MINVDNRIQVDFKGLVGEQIESLCVTCEYLKSDCCCSTLAVMLYLFQSSHQFMGGNGLCSADNHWYALSLNLFVAH